VTSEVLQIPERVTPKLVWVPGTIEKRQAAVRPDADLLRPRLCRKLFQHRRERVAQSLNGPVRCSQGKHHIARLLHRPGSRPAGQEAQGLHNPSPLRFVTVGLREIQQQEAGGQGLCRKDRRGAEGIGKCRVGPQRHYSRQRPVRHCHGKLGCYSVEGTQCCGQEFHVWLGTSEEQEQHLAGLVGQSRTALRAEAADG